MKLYIIILLLAATVAAIHSKTVENQERDKRFHIPSAAEIKAKLKELVDKAKENVNKAVDKVKDIYEKAKKKFEGDEKVIALKEKLEKALNELKAKGELTRENLEILWDKMTAEAEKIYGEAMQNETVQAMLAKAKETWMKLAESDAVQAIGDVASAVAGFFSFIAIYIGLTIIGDDWTPY